LLSGLKVNFIKTAIKSSFKTLNCFLIPTPIDGGIGGKSYDETLQHLENVDLNNLRQDFRLKINELCSYIKNKIGYKNLLGVPLSAPAFVSYMERVVEALNENQQVKIIDSMMASIEYASQQSLENALIMYETEISDFLSINPLPLEWKDLEAAHRKFYGKAIKILEQNLNGENEYTKQYFDQFNQNICVYEGEDGNRKIVGGKYFLLREENSKQIKKYFKDKLNISWNEIMEKTKANKTKYVGEEFGKCYNNLLKSYNEEKRFASSAEKSETFSEWYEEKDVDRVMESITDLSDQIKQRIKSEKKFQKEVALREKAEQDKEEANRQWKDAKEETERKLKEIEERNRKTIENLERELRRPVHAPSNSCTIL
jgi:hypothetical protein